VPPVVEGLVSVIIPVHNRADLLREAVASVVAQSYRPIEIIIVDDGSTDGTPQTIAGLESRHPDLVCSIRQGNSGPGVAREAGRKGARGEYIQYLDSDDLLLPGKLSAQVAALKERPDAGVAYGRTRYRDSKHEAFVPEWKAVKSHEPAMFPSFLEARWWETSTPLYRAAVCEAAGPWSDLWLEEDWEYDCRVASLGTKLVFCDMEVAEHRDLAGDRLSRGTSRDRWRMSQRARAQKMIFESAMRAGLNPTIPEMRNFSRRLFLLARQCGAAGLAAESKKLFSLARAAAGDKRDALDFRLYRAVAGLIGWSGAGRISCWSDRLRKAR
jgi:glycosyltransferase involved in cell wall biosynthesis